MNTRAAVLVRAAVPGALLALIPLWGAVAAGGEQDDWSSLKTGKEVYEAACVSCHGPRGTGVDRSLRGFDVDPPDFSDCKFSSREPDMDWYGIAHSGGPTKGFSPLMPAFGSALSREQLEVVVDHVKGYCGDSPRRWPPGEFNLPKALNTGKAFPEDEVAWSISATVEEPVAIEGKFVVAKRVGARHQLEAVIPGGAQQLEYRTVDGDTAYRWGGGAGDIAVAWKSVLWHCLRAGTIGSVALDVFLPTGDERDGFGKGIFAFEPALALGQIIPRVGFIQLHGGAELSTDTDVADHSFFWRAAVGRTFRKGGFGRAWSPMVEVLGSTGLGEDAPVDWDIVPQLQLALSRRQHVRLGAGVRLPLNDFAERQLAIQAYVVWDWYDGGFAEGW
jgi:mono/diheme cytochrome c family protein